MAPTVISTWKESLIKNASMAFDKPAKDDKEIKKLKKEKVDLYSKVGQLSMEVDFVAKAYEAAGLKKH